MGSILAQRAAIKMSEAIRRGDNKITKGEILRSVGYSRKTSLRPKQVTETQAFKKTFALENKAIVEVIDKEISRVQAAMAEKNLSKEEFKTLVSSLDTLIKNKQLLSGGATANVGISIAISEHVASKYAKVPQKDDDVKTQNGST